VQIRSSVWLRFVGRPGRGPGGGSGRTSGEELSRPDPGAGSAGRWTGGAVGGVVQRASSTGPHEQAGLTHRRADEPPRRSRPRRRYRSPPGQYRWRARPTSLSPAPRTRAASGVPLRVPRCPFCRSVAATGETVTSHVVRRDDDRSPGAGGAWNLPSRC